MASNNGQDLESTNFQFVSGQRSSSSIKNLSSLIAEIEARVEETWEMSDTAGVVLQFSQRKLWPPKQPFLIHLKHYFCIKKPRKRKQRKFYLRWKVSLHPLHLSVLLALLKPFWHTGHFLPFVGFLPLLLLFLTEEDGPLANGFLTGSSVVSDIDKGRV